MATAKQKIAALKTFENLGKDNPITIGQILLETGYAKSISKNPKIITESQGYNETLEKLQARLKIGKHSRLEVLSKILYCDDKRSQIEANKEITKMLGEYAPNQIQIQNAFQSRDEVIE